MNAQVVPECVMISYNEHVAIMCELSRLRDALDDIILDRRAPRHIHELAEEARHPMEQRVWRQ